MAIKCGVCGYENADEDRFCGSCGSPLNAEAFELLEHTGSITSIIATGTGGSGSLSPVGSGRQFQLPTGTALLVVHRGPGEGTEYTLRPAEGTVTVGRAPESGIFLDDVTVSRRHAELRYGAEGWSIRDDGSLNGTYVNRVRVDDHRLSGGDEVQIGKFRFVFLLGLEGPHETPGQ